jgi:hypothetical protein
LPRSSASHQRQVSHLNLSQTPALLFLQQLISGKELIESIENAPGGQHKSAMTEERKAELQAIAKNPVDTGRDRNSLCVAKTYLGAR